MYEIEAPQKSIEPNCLALFELHRYEKGNHHEAFAVTCVQSCNFYRGVGVCDPELDTSHGHIARSVFARPARMCSISPISYPSR